MSAGGNLPQWLTTLGGLLRPSKVRGNGLQISVSAEGDVVLAPDFATTIALSDEATPITTGLKFELRTPFAMLLTEVHIFLNTASSSGAVELNVLQGAGAGTTIFSTRPTIDQGELTSKTAAVPQVFSTPSIPADTKLGFNITSAGSGAIGLKATLIGRRQ